MSRWVVWVAVVCVSLGCGEAVSDVDTDDGGPGEPVPSLEDGSAQHPFVIPVDANVAQYEDDRSTSDSPWSENDHYPPFTQDESGPEYLYTFEVTDRVVVHARLDYPEPAGVDNDLHVLADVAPESVIARDHYELLMELEAGQYYIAVDTFVSDGQPLSGPYVLTVDIAPWHDGTVDDPIPFGGVEDEALTLPFRWIDVNSTAWASGRTIDSYPPSTVDQSGPEVVYSFRVDETVRVTAGLKGPEPEGVDVDLNLVSSLDPVELVARGNGSIHTLVEPGQYWLVADTYVAGGVEMAGAYTLTAHVRSTDIEPSDYFNDYILEAVDLLYAEYGLLGYDSAVLTHDIQYGPYGWIERSGGAKTMCVGGMLEVILTAMELYSADSGDMEVWDFLPERSWERLGEGDFKAHLWVNYDLYAGGTADALRHFGMGENIGFQHLLPGGFINLNRTTGTGHAVVFIAYIDIEGNQSDVYHDDVVGFVYFSAQGGYDEGSGGLDYRYAVFDEFGSPTMPYNRDTKIIYRDESDQHLFNTGMMYHPQLWWPSAYSGESVEPAMDWDVSAFDSEYFTGRTVDDAL